jgi:hypothetical protein
MLKVFKNNKLFNFQRVSRTKQKVQLHQDLPALLASTMHDHDGIGGLCEAELSETCLIILAALLCLLLLFFRIEP